VAANEGIGLEAVGQAKRGAADELTQAAEVAGPGEGAAVRQGDDGGHAGGAGESVLNLLHLDEVQQLRQGKVRADSITGFAGLRGKFLWARHG